VIGCDLNGKVIVIATTDKSSAWEMKWELEHRGGTVIFSKHSPEAASESIVKEVESYNPAPDALILHNSDIDKLRCQYMALEIAKNWARSLPIIVCDCSELLSLEIQDARGKAIYWNDESAMDFDFLAFEIDDAIQQFRRARQGLTNDKHPQQSLTTKFIKEIKNHI
jgi:hypothetical protein